MIKYIEKGNECIYTIKIPKQPIYLTVEDIAIFIFSNYFVIWCVGSGNPLNKYQINKKEFLFENLRSENIQSN